MRRSSAVREIHNPQIGFALEAFDASQRADRYFSLSRSCAYHRSSRSVPAASSLVFPVVFLKAICEQKFSLPKTSSITDRTRCTFSSPIWTKTLPLSVSSSRATRQAIAQVCQIRMDAQFPGVAERADLLRLARGVLGLPVLHVPLARATCQFEPNLMPYGGSK